MVREFSILIIALSTLLLSTLLHYLSHNHPSSDLETLSHLTKVSSPSFSLKYYQTQLLPDMDSIDRMEFIYDKK